MSDKSCGTCKYWKKTTLSYGLCNVFVGAVVALPFWAKNHSPITQTTKGSDCDVWLPKRKRKAK